MQFIPNYLPYPSVRYPIYARNGMVCASSPQAAAAGLEAMKKGGNAMDAAVATAAALTVCEPTANGIGSDAFALIWVEKEKKLYGLNASGFSPRNISIDALKAQGHETMPTYGWAPTMVPGAPAAWAAVANRFGALPMTESMAPAIRYAREGYPASPNLARMWKRAYDKFTTVLQGEEYAAWFDTPRPRASTGALWLRRSLPTARSTAASSVPRTLRSISPSGWSPSRWITGAIPSARSRRTVRASWH